MPLNLLPNKHKLQLDQHQTLWDKPMQEQKKKCRGGGWRERAEAAKGNRRDAALGGREGEMKSRRESREDGFQGFVHRMSLSLCDSV